MAPLLDVVNVRPAPDYSLLLEFENGEKRRFDMGPLMDKKPFSAIKGARFMMAQVDYGTVVWPPAIDISPKTLYARSVPV